MTKKKTITLKTLLIIEAFLLMLVSFFIFQVEDLASESEKKEETLEKIEFIKQITKEYDDGMNDDIVIVSGIMQAEMNSLAYADDHIEDFELTEEIADSYIFGPVSVNPALNDQRNYVTSTSSDGTVYAMDISDYKYDLYSMSAFDVIDNLVGQLFEKDDLFCLINSEGKIVHYSKNPDLAGKSISKLGLELSQLETGEGIWLNIDNQNFYTVTLEDEEDDLMYIAAIHPKTFNINNNMTSILICFSTGIVMALLITYVYFMKQEEALKLELGEPTKSSASKNVWILGLVAVISITIITFHIQSLFSISMFTMVKNTELEIIDSWVNLYEEDFPEEISRHNGLNQIVNENITTLLSNYPELQSSEHIYQLANMFPVNFIKIQDSSSNEIATTPITSTEYANYGKEIQKNIPIYPITSAKNLMDSSEKIVSTLSTKVSNGDESNANTVIIGFNLEHFVEAVKTLDLNSLLRTVSEPGDIEVMAVDPDTQLIIYASMTYYDGISISRIGVEQSSLKDQSLDTMKIVNDDYYSISTAINNYIVFLLEPTNIIFEGRRDLVMTTVFFCTLCIIFLLFLLNRCEVTPLPTKDEPSHKDNHHIVIQFLHSFTGYDYWYEMDAEDRIMFIGRHILNIAIASILILLFFRGSLYENNTILGFIVNGQWQRGLNLYAVTAVVIVYLIYSFVMNIVNYAFQKLLVIVNQKNETKLRLLHSFIVYISMLALIFYCLYLLGVDSKSILASAGIIGLVISWGSQDLITDILAGLFIIFENQFQVNDMIEIDSQRGSVKEIGVRTTRVTTLSGDILSISNRNLSKIINKSQTLDSVGITIYVSFDQNIPEIENMLREELPKLSGLHPGIIDGPKYAGLLDFTDQYARMIINFSSTEKDKFAISCLLNSKICQLFDEHGFEMGIDPIQLKL